MLNNNCTVTDTDPILQEFLQKNQQTKWTTKKLSPSTFNVLQNSGYLRADQTSASHFDVTTSIRIANKPHSTYSDERGAGNSYISYSYESCRWNGCITNIVKLPQFSQPLLIVKSLIRLDDEDKGKDPYLLIPHVLNASVVYNIHGGCHVIQLEKLIGQLVVLCNSTGTFSIGHPTLSIVELTNIVSFQMIQFILIIILTAFYLVQGFVQDNNDNEYAMDLEAL